MVEGLIAVLIRYLIRPAELALNVASPLRPSPDIEPERLAGSFFMSVRWCRLRW
jgi:hypothetical protein